MRGLIYYYSNTGNTKLVCQALAARIPDMAWEFCDIKHAAPKPCALYDLIGFATYTDAWDVPRFFKEYILQIQPQPGQPAFVLNTYGATSGHTLEIFAQLARKQGFNVIAGHSQHMPENYPPMIALGLGNSQAPQPREIKQFQQFASALKEKIQRLRRKEDLPPTVIALGWNKFLPKYPQSLIKFMLGRKSVDQAKCKKCGLCARNCPFGAITLDPFPRFNEAKCGQCWCCYNLCPTQAIRTTYFKRARYPRPNAVLQNKFNLK